MALSRDIFDLTDQDKALSPGGIYKIFLFILKGDKMYTWIFFLYQLREIL